MSARCFGCTCASISIRTLFVRVLHRFSYSVTSATIAEVSILRKQFVRARIDGRSDRLVEIRLPLILACARRVAECKQRVLPLIEELREEARAAAARAAEVAPLGSNEYEARGGPNLTLRSLLPLLLTLSPLPLTDRRSLAAH
eukprot:2381906-Pleurochrysis_carterae.AAC.1